jgi:short-subunit dehydrogenase
VIAVSLDVSDALRGTGVEISCVMPTIVSTELAAGSKQARLSSQVAPEAVAAAISTRCSSRGWRCSCRSTWAG